MCPPNKTRVSMDKRTG